MNKFANALNELDQRASEVAIEGVKKLPNLVMRNNHGQLLNDDEFGFEGLESSEEIKKSYLLMKGLSLSSRSRKGDERDERDERDDDDDEQGNKKLLREKIRELEEVEQDMERIQNRVQEYRRARESEMNALEYAERNEAIEAERLERLLVRERDARAEIERFMQEREFAKRNDGDICEKSTKEVKRVTEERRVESERARARRDEAENEATKILARFSEAERRLEQLLVASSTTSTKKSSSNKNTKRLVEETKSMRQELKLLDEQIINEQKQANNTATRYQNQENSSEQYVAEMNRRLDSLDEQVHLRRLKLAELENSKANMERELANLKARNENESVLDNERISTTQRRRQHVSTKDQNSNLINDNDDNDNEKDKKSSRRRKQLDLFVSRFFQTLRDSPSTRGIFVILFTFAHLFLFFSFARHALKNDLDHGRAGKEHH